MRIVTDKANPYHSPILVQGHHSSSHHDSHKNHRLHHKLPTGHNADYPNIKDFQVINPKITVDHIHDHHIDLQDMTLTKQIDIPAGQEEDHIPRRT